MRRLRAPGLIAGVFILAAAAGLVLTGVLGPLLPARQSNPPTRPTPHPFAALVIELTTGAVTRELTIATDADCVPLQPSQTLYDICSLAVNADPAVIGGAAFGRLNNEHTASLDALIWRARADGDAGVCAAGGLEREWLQTCTSAASQVDYQLADQGLVVRIRVTKP